jgi:hypothetical protein
LVIIVTTPWLVLRRWRGDDVLSMRAINADRPVMRWIDDGSLLTIQQTQATVEAYERG